MNVLRCCLSCEIGWGCYLWCYFFLSGCQFLWILQSCLKSVVFWHGSFCWYIKGWCCVSWKKLVCNGWLIRSCCWVFFYSRHVFPLLTEESVLRHCTGDNFCWGIFNIWIVSSSLAHIPCIVNSSRRFVEYKVDFSLKIRCNLAALIILKSWKECNSIVLMLHSP